MIKFIKHELKHYSTLTDAAIAFMSNYSQCDPKVYTQPVINLIVFDLFMDFIDHVDKPSMSLRQLQESRKIHEEYLHEDFSETEAMLIAMMMIDVRNDKGEYINGFKAEDFLSDLDIEE